MRIKLVDLIGDRATDTIQGNTINQAIISAFNQGEKVELDFSDMKTILSIFLNNAIGALYKNYSSEFLKHNLTVSNLHMDDMFILARVTKRAREFYANEETVTTSLDNSLNGEV